MSDELEAMILNDVPAGNLDLGFLVLDKRHPLHNFYNPCSPPAATDNVALATVALPRPEANHVQAKDLRLWSESVHSTTLTDGLSKPVSATFKAGKKLDAPSIEVHTMKNQLDWFNAAQKDPGVRNWVGDKLKYTTNFYVVVGYGVMNPMSISTDREGTLSASGKAVSTIPGLDPTGELLKVEAGGARNSVAKEHLSATFT